MQWRIPISYLARSSSPSWLGRHFLLAWHLVILLVSWFPFSEWRYTGEGVLAFLAYPLPHYQSNFDNIINVLAYVPLGYAWVMLLRPRWVAIVWAMLAGGILSALVEFVQQFEPGRVASNLDILTNTSGALLGAVAGVVLSKLLVVRVVYLFRLSLFRSGALTDLGIVLLAVWLLTQMNPSTPLFGVVLQSTGIPQYWTPPFPAPTLILAALQAMGVAAHLLSVTLFLTILLSRQHQRGWAVVWLVGLAVLIKMAFAGMLLKPSRYLAWMDGNVLAGMLVAGVLLLFLVRLQRLWRATAALGCTLLIHVVEQLWPLEGPFTGVFSLFSWRYGHVTDFQGLTMMLTGLWPPVAGLFLLVVMRESWYERSGPTILGR
ncbi:VanZ family protein [Burkholderiaceae bacterium DAT-1]|nr:VanZ family protein [Burkholderiaceae bacterium DAT-1]